MISTLRESPEVGIGTCNAVDVDLPAGVLAHRADAHTGAMVFIHNLAAERTVIDLSELFADAGAPHQVFADRDYPELDDFHAIDLAGYGYRWLRLYRNPVG
jgi:maltose alpha-D-glucosyltransferase / alpha-amylase